MELDDELRKELSGAPNDGFDPAVLAAIKTKLLALRALRKPGANKPRKTLLPISSTKGSPGRIERLVHWHYSLALRDLEGRDRRIVRILGKIEAELGRQRGPVYDSAPIRNISSAKKSEYTLAELQRAAQAQIELLTAIANGQPPGREEQAALAAGLKAFGFVPGDAWIVTVLREIERECRRMLRAKLPRTEGEYLERGAEAVLGRLRDELGYGLPAHVDVPLLRAILARYAFHSGGGRRDAVIGRRRAIAMLRSGA